MKEKIARIEQLIDDLDTFKALLSGMLNDPYGEQTVSIQIDLYRSDVDALEQLFSDIEREYGDVKLKDLQNVEQ